MKDVNIIEAKYRRKYLIEIVFNDAKKSVINFESFFKTNSHPQYNKYKKVENFKKFKIENGNVVWGKDWDLIFPLADLYKGEI